MLLYNCFERRTIPYRYFSALSVTTYENEELRIDCGDKPIDILSVRYGRGDMNTCPSYPQSWKTGCWGTKAESVVKSLCQDQHQCSVLVTNSVLKEDPCPGTVKYLLLNYSCGMYSLFRKFAIGCVFPLSSNLVLITNLEVLYITYTFHSLWTERWRPALQSINLISYKEYKIKSWVNTETLTYQENILCI